MPAEIILSQSAIITHLANHFRDKENQFCNCPDRAEEYRGYAAMLEAHKRSLDDLFEKIA